MVLKKRDVECSHFLSDLGGIKKHFDPHYLTHWALGNANITLAYNLYALICCYIHVDVKV